MKNIKNIKNMKKYRLIKIYPGSPKLGSECNELENDTIKSYPEYWDEIIEDDYEIIDIAYKSGNVCEYSKSCQGIYTIKKHFIDAFLAMNCGYTIYSVKRLSDGEIFTLGDNITHTRTGDAWINCVLTAIIIKNEELLLQITQNKETTELYALHNLIVKKIPLFTTYDGVDIFKDSKYYCHVNLNTFDISETHNITRSSGSLINQAYLYFSSKILAEEYVRRNKKLFSYSDMQNLYNNNSIIFDQNLISFINRT